MKTIVAVLAGAVLLAGPALAARHSTTKAATKEQEITKQLNLEQAQQAKNSNQSSSQQIASAGANNQGEPAAAPTVPVESAPAANPAGNADQSQGQNQEANPQPASPAQ